MITLEAKKREVKGRKVKDLRKKGILPAVLYGPKVENISIEIDAKEFDIVYKKAGESSLINLKIGNKEYPVLISETKTDPISDNFIHIDFYQPILTKEVEARVPLVFEGESLAVKELGGTLVKEMQDLEVIALPQNLPHEIRIDIGKLKTFEDEILIKDINFPAGVKANKNLDDVVAVVTPPQKVEEELEKPIEEKVEDVEKIEKKPTEEGLEEEADQTKTTQSKTTQPKK
jgi:large subunit ribosomal protein L25